jgi:hypothetical protein
MVQLMSEASGRERRAWAEEAMAALGDEVAPESHAFWQYLFVVTELGREAALDLVREAQAVEAAGGMTTQDGSRRRTPGGVFFTLAYERLGPKRTKSVRGRATRRFHEELLRRFLRLMAVILPPAPVQRAARAEPADPAPEPRKPDPASRTAAAAKAAGPAAAKPARAAEPEAVEILVVRRRSPR